MDTMGVGRKGAAEPRAVRVPLMLAASEVEAIESYRYAARHPTRSDAIRALIKAGLEALAPAAKAGARKATRPR